MFPAVSTLFFQPGKSYVVPVTVTPAPMTPSCPGGPMASFMTWAPALSFMPHSACTAAGAAGGGPMTTGGVGVGGGAQAAIARMTADPMPAVSARRMGVSPFSALLMFRPVRWLPPRTCAEFWHRMSSESSCSRATRRHACRPRHHSPSAGPRSVTVAVHRAAGPGDQGLSNASPRAASARPRGVQAGASERHGRAIQLPQQGGSPAVPSHGQPEPGPRQGPTGTP